jgi:hypothetical protein
MAYHREDWAPLLSTEFGFERIAPILMTSDPDEWAKKVDVQFNQADGKSERTMDRRRLCDCFLA